MQSPSWDNIVIGASGLVGLLAATMMVTALAVSASPAAAGRADGATGMDSVAGSTALASWGAGSPGASLDGRERTIVVADHGRRCAARVSYAGSEPPMPSDAPPWTTGWLVSSVDCHGSANAHPTIAAALDAR
jgi:hypothetical protein